MHRKRKNIYKIINSNNLPFVIFFVILLYLHFFIIEDFSIDDVRFYNMLLESSNIIERIIIRYKVWSSRVVIEVVLLYVIQFRLDLWRILNIGIYLVLAKSISKICLAENNKLLNFLICGLILLIPLKCLNGAGWVSTTTNYLWTCSFGIYALTIITNYIHKIKIYKSDYVAYFCATVYACNHEQMVVIMFLVLSVFIIQQLYKNGYKYVIKNEKFLLLLLIIAIMSIVFIITCPGNDIRFKKESAIWYKQFDSLLFIEKLELGLTYTMKKILLDKNIIFIIFTLVIFLIGWKKTDNKLKRVLLITPFLVNMIEVFLVKNYIELYFPSIYELRQIFSIEGLIMEANNFSFEYLGVILLYLMLLILIAIDIYIIFKHNIKSYICIGIYLLGLITRLIMCFTPTIFISGERTFLFMYISFIMCTVMILGNVTEEKHKLLLKE